MRFSEAVANVLSDLDDTDAKVWTAAEIGLYVQDGYDSLTRETKCLYDQFPIPNLPTFGNYTAPWETIHITPTSGVYFLGGLMSFTGGEWERQYTLPAGRGPINLTAPWEAGYLDVDYPPAVATLPENTVIVDEVKYNLRHLQIEWSHGWQNKDAHYQTVQGTPEKAILNQDGMFSVRFVRVPTGGATYATHTGVWGALKGLTDDPFGTGSTVNGSWGLLRGVAGYFPSNGPRGGPRRLHPWELNLRVDLYRRGQQLEAEGLFEIPDSCVKYVEFFARAVALERDGPGQDIKLSEHFYARHEVGVRRLKGRRESMLRKRVAQIGSGRPFDGRAQLARLPYPYGTQIRRGRY